MHFSDLHFNQDDESTYKLSRESLLGFLKDKKLLSNYIFITGDSADKGKFNGVVDYIKNLSKNCLNNPKKKIEECVFYVAGNYDVKFTKDRISIIEE
jgi:UDP-2,3-diacylglucosamine pyrophosphatase LpxH